MSKLDVVKSGNTVSLTFMFDDLDVESATYSLFDISGKAVVENVPIAIESGDLSVSFSVSGEHNELAGDKSKDIRRVIVKSVTQSGRVSEYEQYYAIIGSLDLSVPGESFVSLMEAKLAAMDMYVSDSFLMLNDHTQRQALMEATKRLKNMRFDIKKIYKISENEYERPQNVLTANTLPFYLSGEFKNNTIDFAELSEEEFRSLPDYFLKDLAEACMIEAVAVVENGGTSDARDDGLLSESIGETTNMYRSGRSATRSLSRKTWRIIARYIDNTIRIRRG
ncbi:hypothetical protein PSI15_12360 [Xenorhabdus sp. PR6a]|uniref:hypothetical protein n=1 Tax=Xenorhabdus sp. PR6a TaxID=3025877 RepID=UPI00235902B0|nr:hypothetical protein [Xenorhabdus sp. PR6a]MDC9582346.1 hypothetical protein [Xenorhabdus sp. PR6a]